MARVFVNIHWISGLPCGTLLKAAASGNT